MTTTGEIVAGTEIEIPLNRLKKSPRSARKVPHSEAAIEALAASIGAKKLLQKPVVGPERDAAGGLTGYWLVTIGEGRRLALKLLAKRLRIGKAHPGSRGAASSIARRAQQLRRARPELP